MQTVDVLVVGAGLAGLQCTRLLAGYGLKVLLVDRKTSLEQSVHTTCIFVRRALEESSVTPAYLGPPIRHVTLYAPASSKLGSPSPCYEYRSGRMGGGYQRHTAEDGLPAPASPASPPPRPMSVEPKPQESEGEVKPKRLLYTSRRKLAPGEAAKRPRQ